MIKSRLKQKLRDKRKHDATHKQNDPKKIAREMKRVQRIAREELQLRTELGKKKFTYITVNEYIEFIKLANQTGNTIGTSQKNINEWTGILDKYDDIPDLLRDMPGMAHDKMVEPLAYLFECRDQALVKLPLKRC